MNITGTGVAVALAVVVALGMMFFGQMLFTSPDSGLNDDAIMAELMDNQGEENMQGEPPAGLMVSDTLQGQGAEAMVGDTLSVHYIGMLQDGTVFDSSEARGPFSFTVGQGQVIQGWDQGLIGMKEGGKRTLIIPPSMGYGSQDLGVIPPNSTLMFEVELLSVTKP
jgi:FKBP-type peptidyl-prolyl cis-trans isomerase